uniref:Glycosyl hydrolase family 32 N-terminal domain-containing protein n=1 Tax=Fagus sylvatica TaxID=28930 RepID=A0A2N9GKJ7_FAGSY
MAVPSSWLLFFISLLLGCGVLELEASHVYRNLQDSQSTSDKQPYRTSYHFQPPKNWMNALTTCFLDLVFVNVTCCDGELDKWVSLDTQILMDQCYMGEFTIYSINIIPKGAVWAVRYQRLLVGFHHESSPRVYQSSSTPELTLTTNKSRNLAVPEDLSDPFLRKWVKSKYNPLMAPNSENNINSSSFRDPTTAWLGRDGYWRIIIGSKINQEGLAILYKSKDFVHWEEAKKPLYSAKKSGMLECPDFYPVSIKSPLGINTSFNGPDVKHVLKASLDDTKHDCYKIGTYNRDKDIFIPDNGFKKGFRLRYDYGKYYASKTFFEDNSKHRRILWGWVNESSSVDDDVKKGWSGVQAIPRHIWLDQSKKQLVQWPIKEIETLRLNQVNLPKQVLKGGSILEVSGLTAAQADVEISFEVTEFSKAIVLNPRWTNPQVLCSKKGASVKGGLGPFGLLVLASKGLQEYTAVFYSIFRSKNKYVVLLCSDQSRSSLNQENDKTTYGAFVDVDPVHEKLSLRSLPNTIPIKDFRIFLSLMSSLLRNQDLPRGWEVS